MRKVWILFVAAVFTGSLVAAQHEDVSKVQMEVTRVAGNVYMLEGAGGNIGASVGDDGIVIVDDQYAPLAEKIQAALKGITDKPVRFIINTHYHETPGERRGAGKRRLNTHGHRACPSRSTAHRHLRS